MQTYIHAMHAHVLIVLSFLPSAAPAVIVSPSLSSIPQTGDSVTLQCSITLGLTSYTVTYEWRKNGELLETITKHTFESVPGDLMIADIQESDAGFYECSAVYSIFGNAAELTEYIGNVSFTVNGE